VREQRRIDENFRCKSFLVELIVAHLADEGWQGRRLDLEDLTVALEQVFAFIAGTGMRQRISFTDYYRADDLPAAANTAMEVFDPVNPDNNVVKDYSLAHRHADAGGRGRARRHQRGRVRRHQGPGGLGMEARPRPRVRGLT
jgi:hypothetical protein